MMQGTGTLWGWAGGELVADRKARGTLGIGTLCVGGVAQLLLLEGQDPAMTMAVGVLPSLLGDLIKVFLALLLLERLQSTSLGRY